MTSAAGAASTAAVTATAAAAVSSAAVGGFSSPSRTVGVVGASWQATMLPPDIASIGGVFIDPISQSRFGVLTGTQLPGPDDNSDLYQQVTIGGFIRLEEIGTNQVNDLEFDCDLAIHAYHPDETESARMCRIITALAANAQGTTITDGEGEWYVGWSRVAVVAQRQIDPTVDLFRFRSMVTWRVPGHQL